MKRSIFKVSDIFALKPLFFRKNEIKWNQTDMHTTGTSSQFKSSPIEWNQTDRHTMGNFSQCKLSPYRTNQTCTRWGIFLNSNNPLLNGIK